MDEDAEAMKAALEGLPHGPEFRFVDRLVTLESGVRATGLYTIRGDEPFLAGHFPGDPVMPGVLMVEAIAQLAGIAAQPSSAPGVPLRLAAIRAAKVRGTAGPGACLRIAVEITGRLGGLIQAQGSVALGDRDPPLVTAQVTLGGAVGG